MKTLYASALLGLVLMLASAAEPWRAISMPTAAEAAAAFPKPPMEYRAIH